MLVAAGRPFRLKDRLRGSARDRLRLAHAAVRADRGEMQRGAVPGHVGMVPAQPDQRAAVGRQPRRAEEVVAADQHAARIVRAPGQIHRDDGVDGLAAAAVILAHPDPTVASAIDDAVGETPAAYRVGGRCRERLRRSFLRCEAIKPAIGEMREVDRAIRHQPGATAVFVHAGADVERRRHHVGHAAGAGGAYDHIASLLLRPRLQPVDRAAVEPHVGETDRLRDDEIRRDRRPPGAVRCDFLRLGHDAAFAHSRVSTARANSAFTRVFEALGARAGTQGDRRCCCRATLCPGSRPRDAQCSFSPRGGADASGAREISARRLPSAVTVTR